MLSEREQRALDEIEMRLVIDDPRFCRRMNQRSAHGHIRRRTRNRVGALLAYLIVFLIFVAAGLSFAGGGWIPGVVLICAGVAIAAGYAFGCWQRQRHNGAGCP